MSDKILKPARVISRSHNDAAENPTGYGRPVIGRDGPPRRVHDIAIHGGMRTSTKTGVVAFGGDHASALDSLSGQLTVPGKPGSAATAHPLTKPPVAKNYQPPKIGHNQRSRIGEIGPMAVGEAHAKRGLAYDPHDLGSRIFDEALSSSAPDDGPAHPYRRGGV